MSMAFALEFTQKWFRGVNGWKENECGVQPEAIPAPNAGRFYVAIDDMGVEPGSDQTDSLKEIFNIMVGIWIKPEHLVIKDRRGHLKLPIDKYLVGSWTLHDLERAVIIPEKGGLHGNNLFRAKLNEEYSLADVYDGGNYHRPFYYRGRGRMEPLGVDDNNTVTAWFGYRLRFWGLHREQRLGQPTVYAQG